MDAQTYELLTRLHKETDLVLKVATTAQLREIRERMNAYFRRRIDEEIAARGESSGSQPVPFSPEWKSRPGSVARFHEEDEAIHGIN
jgi:hypothetical protein